MALGLLIAGISLRLLYIQHYRIDSDEPQHLHVVWAWTQGLLPYRDVFDNHSPLFQALSAPLFRFFGERPDIVLPMRLTELPLYVLSVLCVWRLAARFCEPKVAMWTGVITALLPPWFLASIEFRPDQLWTLCWLLILLTAGSQTRSLSRSFGFGALLGLSFCVSMKSTLFALALGQAAIAQFIFQWRADRRLLWKGLGRHLGAVLAGLSIPPSLVWLYFVRHHATGDFIYGVIGHNVLPGSGGHIMGLTALIRWSAGAAIAGAAGWAITRTPLPQEKRKQFALLFFSNWFYLLSLLAFWPVVTMEDHLPWLPSSTLLGVPVLFWLAGRSLPRLLPGAGGLLGMAEFLWLFATVLPWQDDTGNKIGMVADTLKLTAPGDFVMDSKGETIYRRRPFRYVLESRTFQRLKRGWLVDDIPDRLARTRTPLATLQRMPRLARTLIRSNYIPIAYRLRVAGKMIRNQPVSAGEHCAFEVVVPQRYALITPSGVPAGSLDDRPFDGPRELGPGMHLFIPSKPAGEIALIWAPALERGYSPFAEIKHSITTAQD